MVQHSGIDGIETAGRRAGLRVVEVEARDHVRDDRIAVAVGGNSKGAKSADDWGWLAARLVMGADWDHPVERDRLRLPEALRSAAAG